MYFMDSQWLKKQFAANPALGKADLAKAIGLDPPAISKILSGTRQIKAQEYMAMRRFFGMPTDDEAGLRNRLPDNPYVLKNLSSDSFKDSAAVNAQDGSQWILPASVLDRRTQTPPEQIRIFEVRENAMEPDFRGGEFVLIDLSDTKPSPPGAFVVSDGFGYMLRDCAYVPRTAPAEISISARGPNFKTQILKIGEFTIVGRVIAKLQMV